MVRILYYNDIADLQLAPDDIEIAQLAAVLVVSGKDDIAALCRGTAGTQPCGTVVRADGRHLALPVEADGIYRAGDVIAREIDVYRPFWVLRPRGRSGLGRIVGCFRFSGRKRAVRIRHFLSGLRRIAGGKGDVGIGGYKHKIAGRHGYLVEIARMKELIKPQRGIADDNDNAGKHEHGRNDIQNGVEPLVSFFPFLFRVGFFLFSIHTQHYIR